MEKDTFFKLSIIYLSVHIMFNSFTVSENFEDKIKLWQNKKIR